MMANAVMSTKRKEKWHWYPPFHGILPFIFSLSSYYNLNHHLILATLCYQIHSINMLKRIFSLLLIASIAKYISGFGIGGDRSSLSSIRKISNDYDTMTTTSNISQLVNDITQLDDDSTESITTIDSRRSFLSQLVSSSLIVINPQHVNALPFFGSNNRRQLEICLVTILRVKYWAMTVSNSMNTKLLSDTTNTGIADISPDQKKAPYLEARLGSKALLTQKIGGGANFKVEELGKLQLKECIEDAKYACSELAKNNQLPKQQEISAKKAKQVICSTELCDASDELLESLASIVEFDGLETTIDPSPRSSLMLSMYNESKGKFIYRTFRERVIPSCERILSVFGDRRRVVEDYVQRDYAAEVPFEVLQSMYDDDSEQQ